MDRTVDGDVCPSCAAGAVVAYEGAIASTIEDEVPTPAAGPNGTPAPSVLHTVTSNR